MSSSTSLVTQSIFRTHTSNGTSNYCRMRSSRIFWRSATCLPTPTPGRLIVPSRHSIILPPIINFSLYISSHARHRSCSFSLIPRLFRRLSPQMSSLTDVGDSTSKPSTKTVKVVVKGRVQGVFYRNWTIENAKELGLRGWVRNRRDGSVEALFSGSADKVEEMEQRCRRGPPAAMVTGFEVSPSSEDPGTWFERKQTV